jgi:hypothetical protein
MTSLKLASIVTAQVICCAVDLYTSVIKMKNHSHAHHGHSHKEPFEPAHPERFAAAQKSTWVSIAINLLLTFLQVVGGFFAHSQAVRFFVRRIGVVR